MASWRRLECIGGIASQIGKATKRSRLGESVSDQITGTQQATEFCVRTGFDFHFIDAEWKHNYLAASELQKVLSSCSERNAKLTTVLTINARHSNAFDNLKDYADVVSQYHNAGFCFVAGNSAYLSEEEKQLDAKSRLRELVTMTRDGLGSVPIFVGSEGQLELASELVAKYSCIPFMLMGGSVQDRVSRMFPDGAWNEVGVYCPYLLSESGDDEVQIKALGQYALRRRWVRQALRKTGVTVSEVRTQMLKGEKLDDPARQILLEAIQTLALCDVEGFPETLRKLSSIGVKYLAFLSAVEDIGRDEEFSEMLSNAMK